MTVTTTGEVFTRRWVVELMLDMAEYRGDVSRLRVVEPSVGGGAFGAGADLLRISTPAGYIAGAMHEQPVTLTSGDAAGFSFGIQAQGSIGGMLYQDRNGNRVADTGEPGIAGATVTLTSDLCGGQRAACRDPQVTDATGRYQFPGLTPGLYQVQAATPATWVAQGATTQAVNLGSAGAGGANFGYQARGAITGVLFQDLDGNASQSHNESGVAGVALTVLQDGVAVAGALSDLRGGYQIDGLEPGSYLVRITLPAGFAPVTPLEQPVLLGDGSAVNVSFGLQPLSTIAGQVYADLNGDGVRQEQEPGLGLSLIHISEPTRPY